MERLPLANPLRLAIGVDGLPEVDGCVDADAKMNQKSANMKRFGLPTGEKCSYRTSQMSEFLRL